MPKKINIVVVGDYIDASGDSNVPEIFFDKEYTLTIKKITYNDNNYWQLFDNSIEAILILKGGSKQKFLDLVKLLKHQNNFEKKPILVIGPDNEEDEVYSYSMGVSGYFAYPINFRKIIAFLVNIFQYDFPANNYGQMSATTADVIKQRDLFYKEFKKIVLFNIDKGISVEMISTEMNMSTKTLTRRVKQYLFTSPARLVVEIKIEYAKKLLASERFSVKKVAFMSGFNSPQHFNTVFKTQEGFTPIQYVRKRIGV